MENASLPEWMQHNQDEEARVREIQETNRAGSDLPAWVADALSERALDGQ